MLEVRLLLERFASEMVFGERTLPVTSAKMVIEYFACNQNAGAL
jgi:hypothetical protein